MRSKKEVQEEIDWQEKEIESIRLEIENKTYKEQDLSFMQNRIWNLTVAITWCKWFLKVD
jgi:hypothetical protein